ncbi:MAG: hypothetical protein Q9195_003189 [Heterodermia aff. obscurata]
MAVTEAVQETVQSVTDVAQHAVGEAKALLPQKELPVNKLGFDLANETFVQLHLHHDKQCPKRGYHFNIETAVLIS